MVSRMMSFSDIEIYLEDANYRVSEAFHIRNVSSIVNVQTSFDPTTTASWACLPKPHKKPV